MPRKGFDPIGVKVSIIAEFVDLMFNDLKLNREEVKNHTTRTICEKVIKPITIENKTSFCEHLKANNNNNIGEPTAFISHDWNSKFLDIVDAIKLHFTFDPDAIIWFDLFSVNHHYSIHFDVDWWRSYKSLITSINNTVLIVTPWNSTKPYHSTWILYELYCTSTKETSEFDIAMTKLDKKR